jgi:EAL domain-containing protein (putative c-di-GMP-specific phosphodiesterase class I)
MLSEICQYINRWNSNISEGQGVLARMTVTRSQWYRPDFPQSVGATLREFGLSSNKIILAVSEVDLLEDLDHSRTVLRELQELGVRVSIDHFGIAERTMDYLNDLPFASLKVDPAITEQLGEDESADRIVRAIVDASHALGMKVLADRVTSTEQLETIAQFGIDFAQGSLISRPLPSIDLGRQLMQLKPSVAGQIL